MITSEILGVRASPKGASPALIIDLHREPNLPAFAQISSFFFTTKCTRTENGLLINLSQESKLKHKTFGVCVSEKN